MHSLSKKCTLCRKSALFVEKVHSLSKKCTLWQKVHSLSKKCTLFPKVHSLSEKVHSLHSLKKCTLCRKKCTLCRKSALFDKKCTLCRKSAKKCTLCRKSALFVEKVHSFPKKCTLCRKKCTLCRKSALFDKKCTLCRKIALFLGKVYNFLEIQDNFYIITCMGLRSYLSYQLSTRLHLDPIFDLQVFRNKKLSWEGARLATNVATGGSKGAAPPRRKSGTPHENGENLRYGWRLVDHWLAELNLNLPSHWLSSYYWWLVASILEVVTISVGNFLHWIEPWCWLVSSSISKLKKLPLLVVSSSIWKWKKLPLLLVSSSVWNLVLHKGSYHLDW